MNTFLPLSSLQKPLLLLFTLLCLPAFTLVALGSDKSEAPASGQSTGTAGVIAGTVADPTGAVIPGASVKIENARTGYVRETKADANGSFQFTDIPFNNYRLTVTAEGFKAEDQTISVHAAVPMKINVSLSVASTGEVVEVSAGSNETIENIPTSHVDLDQTLVSKLPTTSPGAGLSDIITLTAPGVVADSNGFFHPLGDHGEASMSLDGQPIADQQSKAFSTQLPPNAIQSMEVITGAVPAEYGDKTSLVINATTVSGLGAKRIFGSLNNEYGSFGTFNESATFGWGNQKLGNFSAFNFTRSGRFLDSPEFVPFHDEGDSANIFDRFDYQVDKDDTLHLNLSLARNFFQIPNQYDQAAMGQDQRQLVRSINVAPGYVHIFTQSLILTVSPYYRLDQVKYFPSADPFSDQTQTIAQQRRLNNMGIRTDLAYDKGRHNAKAGVQFSHTFLTEGFQFGLTDPLFNSPCVDAQGNPLPGSECDGKTSFPNPNFLPGLAQFDLTRGGHLFAFNGHTDIKQVAFYAQDSMTLGNLTMNGGLRYDIYRGFVAGQALQPRAGLSYLVKRTNTVLRLAYSRAFETPYNENLILSSSTGAGGLANGVLGDATSNALRPGRRNQFNVGMQQALGRYITIDVDAFWKYTHNGYDFNAILNTPITFPISWYKSKIDGVSVRATVNNYKGLSVFFVAGHNRARYFPPESGGLFFNSQLPTGPFRIDHDQVFQQTTDVQYQFSQINKKIAPYVTFTWRYDSGLVAGSVPDIATALALTGDQQAQIGLHAGNIYATPGHPLVGVDPSQVSATLVVIPAAGTENDDTNPPRIAPRHLFNIGVGTDNLLGTERAKMTLKFSVINLTNKVSLYNFLSTFSGTHFVAPRTYQASVGVTF